jgi:hypothetical protein
MSTLPSFKLRPGLPTWRVCLCVLLITLVVYNPYAALNGSSDRLSYDKLASNRASIGSSELQHFSPVPAPDSHIELDVDLRSAEPVRCLQESQPSRDQLDVIPAEPELLAGVWFRPPPSL